MSEARAIGTLALVGVDCPCNVCTAKRHGGMYATTGQTNVIEEIDKGDTTRSLFMLASMILDLWARLDVLFLAARDSAMAADPADAARLLAYREILDGYLSTEQPDWRSRAIMAHRIMHSLLDRAQDDHWALLHAAAGGAASEIRRAVQMELGLPPHEPTRGEREGDPAMSVGGNGSGSRIS